VGRRIAGRVPEQCGVMGLGALLLVVAKAEVELGGKWDCLDWRVRITLA
jgi:hypothetical protein